MREERKITVMKYFNKYMVDNKISTYKLSRMVGIPATTLSTYKKEQLKLPLHKGARLADCLGVEIGVLFPEVREWGQELIDLRKGEYNIDGLKDSVPNRTDEEQKQLTEEELDMEIESRQVTFNDMVAGASELLNEDGVTLMVREVINDEFETFKGYVLQEGEQLAVLTGIKAECINMDRTLVRVDDRLSREHSITVNPFPVVINKELAVILQCNGKEKMLSRKTVVGKLIFI